MVDRPAPKKDSARTGSIPVELDATDREILRSLRQDGRMSNTDIARRIGVTETTIRKRLAALIEGDYVNIVAVPTPKLAGLTVSAILGFSVELRSLSAVAQALVEQPEVRYCGISTGRYDLIVEAEARGREGDFGCRGEADLRMHRVRPVSRVFGYPQGAYW